MDCYKCQNCYIHSFNYNQLKYRCRKKGHREIEQISKEEKEKCSEFKTVLFKK